ncbi:family 10 glycosylhydrolase [Chroococcidiopsis sp. FACHB-1243]|uniref:glycoside hydrolase family 10 protein n=1 Tax=Chroococcidiopsis sp. [FACHB-1243] TaxID=2692781 RepID=UPI00177F0B05|nr:family 10 glycosylhydrolase [Chroococcidiopsis sp. [FACHB-1243]]MBD2305999.1 family 10 glycosylhydrolase [Chroococcidiopsis sp. [FACHB-1243]]
MSKNFDIFAFLPTLVRARSVNFLVETLITSLLLPLAFHLPATAAEEPAVLAVVKSEDNAAQWTEISSRIQAAGVNYCVVDLAAVKNASDLSDRSVIFLPNVENIDFNQALALEAWMSRGGKVIASGAVGSTSQPGVRQLLSSLLGAYWGFPLDAPNNLQTLQGNSKDWLEPAGNDGLVQGGVVIPTGVNSRPIAIWQSQINQAAVVKSDRATVLGWRWGSSHVSPGDFDRAWLRASLSQYISLPESATVAPQNCSSAVAESREQGTESRGEKRAEGAEGAEEAEGEKQPSTINHQPSTINHQPSTINQLPADEAIERIAPPGLDGVQAFALKQELDNLIGRFESAQLAARAFSGSIANDNATAQLTNSETTAVATTGSFVGTLPESAARAVAEAKAIAKNLPQAIAQKDFAGARQQWHKAQALLWQNYPVEEYAAQPEIRAMWLDRGSIIRAGSEQGLAKIFDRLAAAGINTIFFETVNAGYPIYPSQVAPQPNPLVRGWDPLASAVKLAHDRNMELHAWVWTFAVGNKRHNTLINLPADYPGPVIAAHPEWASYDNRGSLFPPGQGKPFLDPANPAARQYLFRLYEEIVSRYNVDGLQLDYIRYPFQDPSADRTYGYGIAARQQFQQLTGVDPTTIKPSDRDLWQRWTQFRTQQIDGFVAQASRYLKQKRPNLVMSVAVFPLSEHDRTHKLQQHWEVWANRGDVDLIVPMTYALDSYRFQRLAQPWITSSKLGSALLLPGIRLLNLPTMGAFDQIQLVRDLPGSGYALFAVENLNDDLQQVFHNTQGTKVKVTAPVPYRQPFHTAAARYVNLRQEWQFLLANDRLWLKGTELSEFNTRSQNLETALARLAQTPSVSNLAAARTALNSFQSQFKNWMRSQALENSYQVNVWSNRLTTLERLLNYGERVVLKSSSPLARQR